MAVKPKNMYSLRPRYLFVVCFLCTKMNIILVYKMVRNMLRGGPRFCLPLYALQRMFDLVRLLSLFTSLFGVTAFLKTVIQLRPMAALPRCCKPSAEHPYGHFIELAIIANIFAESFYLSA